MSPTNQRIEIETYLPTADDQGELLDLCAVMEERGRNATAQPAIVTASGERHELTPQLADLMVHVVRALADGQGVTVIPRQRLLTTQEAADLLNVSRPTLVKALEAGDIPFETRGRHRRVRLDDLLAYQARLRVTRAAALTRMQQESQEGEVYDVLDAPPPKTR